jgi:uncharacterized protein YecT (DUF1311 family)
MRAYKQYLSKVEQEAKRREALSQAEQWIDERTDDEVRTTIGEYRERSQAGSHSCQ